MMKQLMDKQTRLVVPRRLPLARRQLLRTLALRRGLKVVERDLLLR